MTCKDSICKGDPEVMKAGKCQECSIYQAEQSHQACEADVRLNNLLARNEELKGALNSAAYSLFEVKRMVGVPQHVINHVREAHTRACEILDK